jgi:hypothetical protein
MPHQKANVTNAAAAIAMVVIAVNAMVIAQIVLSVQLSNLLSLLQTTALLKRHPCKLSFPIQSKMLLLLKQLPLQSQQL